MVGFVIRSKQNVLILGFSVAILGSILGTLALNHRLPWQTAGVGDDAAFGDPDHAPDGSEVDTEVIETQQRSKITFQEALRIAKTVADGEAYGIERETEEGRPVIEVEMAGQEIFVDAESGEIVLIEDLYQKGDREDIEEVTEALELQQFAIITLEEAMQAAESFADGQVHEVELENEDGSLVYEVMIDSQEVYVDAGNGQVLFTERVGIVDSSDGSQPKSSIQIPFADDDD